MRCNSCNKFVSYGDPEVEVDETSFNSEEMTVDVTVKLQCAECSEDLKTATETITVGPGEGGSKHECNAKDHADHIGADVDLEAAEDDQEQFELSSAEGTCEIDSIGSRTVYFLELTAQLKCNRCGEDDIEVIGSSNLRPYEFEEV